MPIWIEKIPIKLDQRSQIDQSYCKVELWGGGGGDCLNERYYLTKSNFYQIQFSNAQLVDTLTLQIY